MWHFLDSANPSHWVDLIQPDHRAASARFSDSQAEQKEESVPAYGGKYEEFKTNLRHVWYFALWFLWGGVKKMLLL